MVAATGNVEISEDNDIIRGSGNVFRPPPMPTENICAPIAAHTAASLREKLALGWTCHSNAIEGENCRKGRFSCRRNTSVHIGLVKEHETALSIPWRADSALKPGAVSVSIRTTQPRAGHSARA